MAITLNQPSLDWALAHILRHGDTDVFPDPFEFSILAKVKPELVACLQDADLDAFRCGPAIRMMLPKHTGGFRAVCQLDVIDSLLITALVAEDSDTIEKARVPIDERVACAYRMAKNSNGDLFSRARLERLPFPIR